MPGIKGQVNTMLITIIYKQQQWSYNNRQWRVHQNFVVWCTHTSLTLVFIPWPYIAGSVFAAVILQNTENQ